MAMNNISVGMRNDILTAINARLVSGKIRIFTAAFATLLAEFTVDATPYSAPSGGSMTIADTPLSTTAAASGTAAVCRFLNSSDGTEFEGTVAVSGADINISNTSITSGGTVQITGGTITMPAS